MDFEALKKEHDPGDYYSDLINFPDHVRKALNQMKEFNIEFKPNKILVCGMGGSGIPGHLLKNYCSNKTKVLVEIESSYDIPLWVDNETLAVIISYSGNTEETLSCLKQALAKKINIITISAGGLLEKAAIKYNLPFIKAPSKLQPRAATPYLFTYLLEIMHKLGCINIEYTEALNELDKLDLKINSINQVQQFAELIVNKSNYVYVFVPRTLESIGLRYVEQDFNENAKLLAKYSVIPEANHNETTAWPECQDLPFACVFLLDPQASSSINTRMAFQKELCMKKTNQELIINAKGKSLISRMLTSIYQGDMLSYYISLLRHKDPLPVPVVEELKKYVETKTTLKNDLIKELGLQ